ncbi:hybrid sensor histidine kinase/response regulator [Pigmentibacter sp. JX0631]|uniref:ATP-binding response regulator n=1 Tax=Pigmentibacter sp. JX0631 TaxID=2976982 RepID=UPI0024692B96|nr:hybrid sensor histidine kinase/response regulator [Pigmentibacter sp. JX0631]WGL58960.1 hybrid sensor histidine kinase/response regulator [Pigmentibacter sp. JX0631]
MKLRPISEEILKRSARKGLIFSVVSFCIILIILSLYAYDVYFGRTQKLVRGYVPEISSALIFGDVLFVKKMISSIEKSLYFSTIYIYDQVDDKLLLFNGESLSLKSKLVINKKYSLIFRNGEIYFLTTLPMQGKDIENILSITFIQKINYFLNFLILFLVILFPVLTFLYVRRQSKKNYEEMFIPIMTLSENLKGISTSKEQYEKFVNYLELDLIYKNINSVYLELNNAQEQLKQMHMMRAISNTIQMLAHDLRHPFAHIKNALHVMLRLSSYDEIRQYIKDTGRAIEKDIMKVENMLSDLLHFRTEGQPNIVETSFYKLIYSVVKNCFEVQNKTNIELLYDFKHQYFVNVDIQKMERVLSNIITNAIEAMNGKGVIQFSTREYFDLGQLYIEICIANTNSYIEEEYKDKIFDLFFTKGKKRGTGIGLGIAKEIVQQHGGDIFFQSSKSDGVKFFIKIPHTKNLVLDCKNDIFFPSNAQYFESNFDSHYNISLIEYENKSDIIEKNLLNELSDFNLSKKYKILILEDDEVYVKNFYTLISNENLRQYFELYSYSNYAEAHAAYFQLNPEFVICDIDLGLEDLNGFDFVSELRKNGSLAKICIHTNRFFKCDLEKSISVKSDFFIAKPMSRFQFLKFLYSLINPNYSESSFFTSSEEKIEITEQTNINILPLGQKNLELMNESIIIFIDDEEIYHKFWEMSVSDAKVLCFSDPTAAIEYIFLNPHISPKIVCVVVDYYYDNICKDIIQLEFLAKIKEILVNAPVFVSTNGIFVNNELELFDGVIKKEPHSLSKLKELFREKFIS